MGKLSDLDVFVHGQIVSGRRMDHSISEIVRQLGFSMSIVSRVCPEYMDGGKKPAIGQLALTERRLRHICLGSLLRVPTSLIAIRFLELLGVKGHHTAPTNLIGLWTALANTWQVIVMELFQKCVEPMLCREAAVIKAREGPPRYWKNSVPVHNSVQKPTRIEGSRDIAIALDGSWQKGGYQSLNGIVTATSVDTEKIIDLEVFSKHCRCKTAFNSAHEPSCTANYSRPSVEWK
ncbi:hypothetical protein TNCV_4579541 [Trichonephila clavipes]|nr:hypothetical protein TNCV_4579541 [Trichonephila clavipes]